MSVPARVRIAATTLSLLVLGLLGCAASKKGTDYDPLESVNRPIFWFNQKADDYVLEPIARGWDWIAPDRVEQCISNFFLNLRFPINLGNDMMQLRPRDCGVHISRFMVNTTVGIGGLFDPAADWGLVIQEEDFGQTLGRWGVGPGAYLMLPILGPSSARDIVRFPVDGYLSGLPFALDGLILMGMSVGEFVNFRAVTLGTFDDAEAASLDYYTFVRNAYLQRRQALVNDSNVAPSDQSEDLYDVDQYETDPYEGRTPFN